jgi:hypothetical protein
MHTARIDRKVRELVFPLHVSATRLAPVLATAVAVLLGGCGPSKPPLAPDSNSETTAESPENNSSSSSSRGAPATSGTSTPGAGIQERGDRNKNAYDKEATDVVLRRAARQAEANCGFAKDEAGVAAGPWGKLTVKLTLGHNGRLRTVTVPASYDGKPAGKCIEKAYTGLIFPTWEGADLDLDWDLDIAKPAPATPPTAPKTK